LLEEKRVIRDLPFEVIFPYLFLTGKKEINFITTILFLPFSKSIEITKWKSSEKTVKITKENKKNIRKKYVNKTQTERILATKISETDKKKEEDEDKENGAQEPSISSSPYEIIR
jgi:predicted Holliday junction resolvase-like endonuclease